MKTIDYINKFIYSFTVLLFIISIGVDDAQVYAWISQFVLGFIQIILAMFVVSKYATLNSTMKQYIKIYWFLAMSCLTLIFLSANGFIEIKRLNIYLFCIIPMCIATYFTFITHKINYSK